MLMEINILGREYPIEVVFKNITKVRLKVFSSGEIKLSVPLGTPEKWVADFLEQKKGWIEKRLEVFEQTKSIEKEDHIISGSSTRILGRQMTICVIPSNKKDISFDDLIVNIYTTETEQNEVDKQFNNWWQKQSKQYFQSIVDKLYPIFKKHDIPKPTVFVGKMQTLWGSCSRKYCKINLNYYLYKASAPCIEYVILHEMTHLIYPNHDKDFYDFISIYMPDWKERKKQLDYEFVLGV